MGYARVAKRLRGVALSELSTFLITLSIWPGLPCGALLGGRALTVKITANAPTKKGRHRTNSIGAAPRRRDVASARLDTRVHVLHVDAFCGQRRPPRH